MGGDKNFEDPMQLDQDIWKTRYGRRSFYNDHPLFTKSQTSNTPNTLECKQTNALPVGQVSLY